LELPVVPEVNWIIATSEESGRSRTGSVERPSIHASNATTRRPWICAGTPSPALVPAATISSTGPRSSSSSSRSSRSARATSTLSRACAMTRSSSTPRASALSGTATPPDAIAP
jgi:hypothetical protein